MAGVASDFRNKSAKILARFVTKPVAGRQTQSTARQYICQHMLVRAGVLDTGCPIELLPTELPNARVTTPVLLFLSRARSLSVSDNVSFNRAHPIQTQHQHEYILKSILPRLCQKKLKPDPHRSNPIPSTPRSPPGICASLEFCSGKGVSFVKKFTRELLARSKQIVEAQKNCTETRAQHITKTAVRGRLSSWCKILNDA